MINYTGLLIPGYTKTPQVSSPDFKVRRVHNWGRQGVLEMRSPPGGRAIVLYHTLVFGGTSTSYQQLDPFFEQIDNLVGHHGGLTVAGGLTSPSSVARHQYSNCTFESWTKAPFPGQEVGGPIKDVGGCFGGGWIMQMQLSFYQILARRR